MAISRTLTAVHAGNPTTAPTVTIASPTLAGDIVLVLVTNGGANTDPASITGTHGLTFVKKASATGAGVGGTMSGSLWWARCTGTLSGRTIIAATTTSGSMVVGIYRGCRASGDPFQFASAEAHAPFDRSWYNNAPRAALAGQALLLAAAVDDDVAGITTRPSALLSYNADAGDAMTTAVSALSTAAPGTGAALYELLPLTADTNVDQVDVLFTDTITSYAVMIAAALIPEPAAPTVTSSRGLPSGSAAGQVFGTVNPNGASTTYWFEYGPTISYGSTTARVSAGSGVLSVNVVENLLGLLAGTTYHFRLVASNSVATVQGRDLTFTTASGPAEAVQLVRERPPLWLATRLTPVTGYNSKRWSGDEPNAADRIQDQVITTSIPGGFDTMTGTLPRRPGIDYGDLGRFSDGLVYGAGGRVAWHGRLSDAPRVSGDEMSVTPGAVGYKDHLEDNQRASMVFICRDMGRWTGPGGQRRLDLMNLNIPHQSDASAAWDSDLNSPALVMSVDAPWVAPWRPIVEAWYDAGPNNRIASIGFGWTGWPDLAFILVPLVALDPTASRFEAGGAGDVFTAASGSFVFNPSNKWRYGVFEWYYNATPAGADGAKYAVKLTSIRVFGDHGLVLETGPSGFVGFRASSIMSYAIPKWAPQLRTTVESIQPTSYIIPQAAYYDFTSVSAMLDDVTRYGLEDWAVWEDRVFWIYTRGTVGKRWRARVGPSRLREAGQTTERLWNGVVVRYQDVDGTTRTVGPPGSGADVTDASLLDTDPLNAANMAGIVRTCPPLDMGIVSVSGAAIQVGARYLQECKALDRAGSAELVGTIYDDKGVEHPVWAVRAGDTIQFMDSADTSERRIVRTSYNADSVTCSIDLDAPPQGMDAILARLGLVSDVG